jgi:signal transduction histidine kinase
MINYSQSIELLVRHNQLDMPQARTIKIWVGIVLAVSLLPALLQWSGQSFATHSIPLDLAQSAALSPAELSDALHHALSGSFIHTILEWSAFGTAILTAVLAFLHFTMHHDWITPVIGLMLFYAGCMDAFHTLAADRLINSAASSVDLIPFTWVLCRIFSACILIVGILVIARSRRQAFTQGLTWFGSSIFVASLAIGLGILAYATIWACLQANSLPQTTFANSWVSRPWDLVPLGLFSLLGLWILPNFYRVHANYFSFSLWIGMIPQVATQLHMAFGSTQLFDTDFNSAHFLKIIAYLVPFSGLCLSYIQTNRERAIALEELKTANQSLLRLERLASDRADDLNRALVNLRQTQSQLIHAEKMSGLDRLVAGIAHEINNPVGFIVGNLRYADNYMQDLINLLEAYQETFPNRPLSLQKLECDIDLPFLRSDFPKLMGSIQRGANRISSIVSALRSFSGLDEQGLKPLNLQSSLQHGLLILNHRISVSGRSKQAADEPYSRPAIVIETSYADDVPDVLCYANQINQVLLHLLTNAIDALDEAMTRGRLEREPGWQPKLGLGLAAVGDRVRVTVQDNGVGIPATVQDRLFDPFFTTKPVGKGTGLGLSVSERIVKAHGGTIRFHSVCDRGTTFEVELPRRPDDRAVSAGLDGFDRDR